MHRLDDHDAERYEDISEGIARAESSASDHGLIENGPPLSGPIDETLDIVSEAAQAIRRFGEESALAVNRARDLAEAAVKNLDAALERADRAEAAQLAAESAAASANAEAAQLRSDIETLQDRLAMNEAKLAAATERADEAHRRAEAADAGIARIAEAVRTQLPILSEAAVLRTERSAA
jgi:predicted  nucleic acid-binding Zn-ribbon protein